MTALITKTWFEDGVLHSQKIEENVIYKKEWVGLTEQDRNDIEDYCEIIIGKPAFDAIEAKLKEKNNG